MLVLVCIIIAIAVFWLFVADFALRADRQWLMFASLVALVATIALIPVAPIIALGINVALTGDGP